MGTNLVCFVVWIKLFGTSCSSVSMLNSCGLLCLIWNDMGFGKCESKSLFCNFYLKECVGYGIGQSFEGIMDQGLYTLLLACLLGATTGGHAILCFFWVTK